MLSNTCSAMVCKMPRCIFLLSLLAAICRPSCAFTAQLTRRSISNKSATAPPLTLLHMNDHDIWWEERRARNRAAARGYSGAGPMPPQMMDPFAQGPGSGGGQPLDQISLETLLVAFAESDYIAEKFRFYGSRVSRTDRGPVFDVFQHASISGGNIELELRQPFDEGKKQYLDRLAKYIRARYPHERLQIYHINRDGRDVY